MSKPTIDLLIMGAASALLLSACGSSSSGDTEPKCNFDSTYAAIQETIFEARDCTSSPCHGESLKGGLDLRAGASYAALVRVPSVIDDSIQRVLPGDQDLSLLYRKLQQSNQELQDAGLGQAMPFNAEPLTADQLEAIRLWIRGGAPEHTIVAGTMNLLGCSGNFEADPNKIAPLPPPPAGEGVQLYAGGWALGAEAEDEVCYVTYYDFTDVVPEEYQVDCDEFDNAVKCFAFRRNELAQDGQSHHSIITVYTPESDPDSPVWGEWSCLGGDSNGQSCDPTEASACGPRSQCGTAVRTSVACIAYPFAPDGFSSFGAGALAGTSGTRVQLTGAQESTFIDEPQVGVYSRLPLKGFIAWNSHAFNLTKKDTTIEQWVNLTFAPEAERSWLRQQIFDVSSIFAMTPVAPFSKREVCMTFILPQYSRLMSLSSHMHERGEQFRIWLPPNESCAGSIGCAPPDSAAEYESRLYNDPLYKYYDPPIEYDSEAEVDRTFKACAVYDNGADEPFEVKRESTKPNSAVCGFPGASCGCSASQRACFGGDNQGASCGGDDAVCGEGGMCDACPLNGGITTDDEMFIPLGSYFVQPP